MATVLLALLFASEVRADRALAPTDALGSWAIEVRLAAGANSADRLVQEDPVGLRVIEVEGVSPALGMRVWPGEGFYAGVAARWQGAKGGSNDDGVRLADVTLESGVRRRLGPSIPWAIELRATLPAGDPLRGSGRYEVELTPRLGLSFTPRHDFYFDVSAGKASEDDHGLRSELWTGFSAGMAYQTGRFTLLLFGSNRWHLAEPANFRSVGGGFAVGFEIAGGLSLGWEVAGKSSVPHLVATGVRGSFSEWSSLFSLRWTYYPGARRNTLRKEDPRRGREYMWWNPNPGPSVP